MAAMQLADKGGIQFNFDANSRYWLNSAQPAGFLEFVGTGFGRGRGGRGQGQATGGKLGLCRGAGDCRGGHREDDGAANDWPLNGCGVN